MYVGWGFDIMINNKTFSFIFNLLDLEECRLPVILTRRKPGCWHCGEIGHLLANCPGKKVLEKSLTICRILSPPIAKGKKEALSLTWCLFLLGKKIITPPSETSLTTRGVLETTGKSSGEKLTSRKNEWKS